MGSDDWTAIHDHMPGKHMTLTIRGTVMLPSTGYTNVRLAPADNQGTNPKDYRLEVQADPPSGISSPVVTPYEVAYREPDVVDEYDTVSIEPEGPAGIKVLHPT